MPDKVIGIINYLGPNGEIGETQDFTDVNEYLSGIEKAFDEYGINGWRYVTQTNDLDVNYKVYVLASGEFGKEPISRKAFHLQHPEYVLPPVTFGVVEDTPWGRMKVVRQQDFDKAFAQGATDFSNCYFEDVTFSGEAAEISFQNSILANGCQFDHAHFKGASFDGASIYCSIQDCDLSRSSFLHTTINGHIKRTDLSGCFFKDSHINKTSFADCILNRCIMYETALNSTYFVRCEAFGLQHMDINDRRIRNYVAPASSADIRTALNIFSSALSHLLKFVDAEIEQLICDQSPEFDAQRFIDQPTAIFLICPDENPTRHFLASLFVRSFTDELIELAETKYNETLPRKFLYFLDEFGNMPPIENATALFSAIRSRGGRVMCALQAYDQLRLNYTEHQAATIEKNCHVQMNSAVAPAADKDAKRISEMLGNETILTGSKSKTRGVTTTNTSLIGRPLMSPAQLVTMPIGTFVVQCVSQNPYKSYLPDYSEYLELATEFLHPAPIRKYTPVLVAAPRMITMNARGSRIEIQKGMFDVADEEW